MKKGKGYSFRMLMNDTHLWLGIGSGILLFLVCLSGTVLTFEEEIKSGFSEDFEVHASLDNTLSLEQLVAKVSGKGSVTGITIPVSPDESYQFSIKTDEKQRRGTTFLVDPFTGKYQKEGKNTLDGFFFTMFKLHRWLLLDSKIGRPIVGVATLIFFFMCLSGLYLWFPKKVRWKNLKSGFQIKFSANWKRINYDAHNTLGFYACIFLVIMTLTGLCWSFEWYRDVGSSILGAKIFGNRGGAPVEVQVKASAPVLSLSQIYGVAQKELPYAGELTISLPTTESDPYRIRKKKESSMSPVIADQLVLDRNGTVLQKEMFRDKPINEQIASLIKPIHTGQIYGLFSKTIYFMACLIATSLPITGTLIWVNKLKKKRKRKMLS